MTTVTKSASTNNVMMVMIQSSQLWNQMMFSITGDAACCNLISHGAGCPIISANAVPLAASATPTTANPSNRRPIWPLDIFMPLALP
jgi:hypothetical protein